MNNAFPEILTIMVAAVTIGFAALLLVANELGGKARLGIPGRLALAGGLGFGVLAFAIKIGVVLYLGSLSRDALAPERPSRIQATSQSAPVTATPPPAPVSRSSFRVWRALPEIAPSPPDNPVTPEKVTLGRKLFFDPALSADGTVSCASCHRLEAGGDDDAAVSTGIGGARGDRNAPSVWNAAFLSRLFWDGRAASLEAQAIGPLTNPVEMGMPSLSTVEAVVRANPAYQAMFADVFRGSKPVSIDNIVSAIAAYERTLITPNTPYDRFVRGDDAAMTPQQIRGMAQFQETGCRTCHVDPTFSGAGLVRSFGAYRQFPVFPGNRFIDKYDLLVDGRPQVWRVPSLRNVALTAPYFHNGSVETLEEAIRVMAVSQLNKVLSDDPADDIAVFSGAADQTQAVRGLSVIRDRALSRSEITDIAAFLRSLSADLP